MNNVGYRVAILILVYLLFFWSDAYHYCPGMDSMTYGSLAKHILDTEDWATLRNVKYWKGFMLDPFLATFSLGAIYPSVRAATSGRARPGLFFISGFVREVPPTD